MYKHFKQDPRGEEKKLTDEEIVKALDICYTFKGCTNEFPYFNKNGRNFCLGDKRFYKDLKGLIHRLQSENAELLKLCEKTNGEMDKMRDEKDKQLLEQKAEIELLKSEIEKECQEHIEFAKLADKKIKGLGKARKNDYENFCEERGEFNKTIDEQKAEIERLTEERDMYADDLYWKAEVRKREDFITELTVETAELQKQVDELKKPINGKFKDNNALNKAYESLEKEFTKRSQRLRELQNKEQVIECHGMLKGCDMVKQAVKDTAKKSWELFKQQYVKGYDWVKCEFEKQFGVEVE